MTPLYKDKRIVLTVQLNFPTYPFRFRKSDKNQVFIFDESRKKFIVLTPEEWVRQHALQFLIQEKQFPLSLIELEKEIKQNNRLRRFDLVAKSPQNDVLVLLECKAPDVNLSQATFDQIIRYNNVVKAKYLWVTNGLQHFYFAVDFEENVVTQKNELPLYHEF